MHRFFSSMYKNVDKTNASISWTVLYMNVLLMYLTCTWTYCWCTSPVHERTVSVPHLYMNVLLTLQQRLLKSEYHKDCIVHHRTPASHNINVQYTIINKTTLILFWPIAVLFHTDCRPLDTWLKLVVFEA